MTDNQSPINDLPPVIIVLVVVMAGIEIAFIGEARGLLGGPGVQGWRNRAVLDYAFAPSVLEHMTTFGPTFETLKRFVTYPFIHAAPIDALFGVVLILALGKFVGDIFGSFATGILFFATAIFGALVFGVLLSGNAPLIGAYPAAYGLIGAHTYIIWLNLGRTGQNQLAAFRLIGFLLALQLVYGVLFGTSPRWIAELAGFVAGFAMAPLLAPGGWRAFVSRMRER